MFKTRRKKRTATTVPLPHQLSLEEIVEIESPLMRKEQPFESQLTASEANESSPMRKQRDESPLVAIAEHESPSMRQEKLVESPLTAI